MIILEVSNIVTEIESYITLSSEIKIFQYSVFIYIIKLKNNQISNFNRKLFVFLLVSL